MSDGPTPGPERSPQATEAVSPFRNGTAISFVAAFATGLGPNLPRILRYPAGLAATLIVAVILAVLTFGLYCRQARVFAVIILVMTGLYLAQDGFSMTHGDGNVVSSALDVVTLYLAWRFLRSPSKPALAAAS